MLRTSLVFVATLALSACGSLLSQKHAELAPTTQDRLVGETMTLPAQLRTVTVKPRVASFLSCAEPGPDVALSDTFKLITAVTSDRAASASDAASASTSSNSKTGASNDLQTSTTALELAGRTQTVLLAREFLFRTCEAAANGWLVNADVKAAHEGTLKQIAGMVAADTKKAETAGTLAVVAAGIKLDAKILLGTSSAVRDAIQGACLREFEACAVGPGIDDKAKTLCRSTFNECTKP